MGKNSKWIVGCCAGCAVGFVVALVIGAACYFGWQHYKQNTDGDSSLEWLTTGDTDDEELSNLSERERILVGRWDYRKMQYEKKEDMHVAFNAVFDFQKNMDLKADGTLKVSVASTITAIYKLAGKGDWKIDDEALVMNFQEMNVTFIKYIFDGKEELSASQTRKIERTLKNDVCKELEKQLKGENRSVISTLNESELTTNEGETFKKLKD